MALKGRHTTPAERRTGPTRPLDGSFESLATQLDRSPVLASGRHVEQVESAWKAWAPIHAAFRATPDEPAQASRYAVCTRLFGKLEVVYWRCTCETQLTVQISTEKYLLLLPLHGAARLRAPGVRQRQEIVPSLMGLMPAVAESSIELSPGTQLVALVLPQTSLADALEALAGLPIAGRVMFDEQTLSVDSGVGRMIRKTIELIAELMLEDRHGEQPLHNLSAIASALEQALALAMLSEMPHSFTDVLVSQEGGSVPGTVRRAEAFVRSRAGDPIGLEEIAAAAGCGQRALQIAFRRFRSTTPLTYLRTVRLERAHDALLRADRSLTMAEIVSAWHFPHLGRFSATFRQVYGENPSETLKRGRRRSGAVSDRD